MSKPTDNQTARERIRSSALWAAYGDALGFITEGVDSSGVVRRAGTPIVEKTVAWRRRIGGKFGPTVPLPAGCVSDDTQLRLATSRSIGAEGEFDVETFAKVELPVWLSYALGAGKGSQEAAGHLRRRDATWATNFFVAERARYLDCGGNGAAMRIQPHVWSSRPGAAEQTLVRDIIVNAVATHGHARGIIGAVFHARCLSYALERREVPGPAVWDEIAQGLPDVAALVQSDDRLMEIWLGQWEVASNKRFAEHLNATVKEVQEDLHRCREASADSPSSTFSAAVNALGAVRPDQRGSGTKSAILAALAAWLYQDQPNEAVALAANALGTDTDTIATMAGAIVGAVATTQPDGPIADREYILHEADRMWAIREGLSPSRFPYPNLVKWTAPKSASDCLGRAEAGVEVAGLGPARLDSETYATTGKTPANWQWLRLWFGQRILMKSRARPNSLPTSQVVAPVQQYLLPPEVGANGHVSRNQRDTALPSPDGQQPGPLDLHQLSDRVIASGFDPAAVGQALLAVADRPDGIEAAIAYASIIAKARLSRRDRERRSPG